MLNPVHHNVPVDVTLVPEDGSQILYVYRNVIWAIRRKNQSYLFRKMYACMENQFLYFSKKILISELFNNINAVKSKWAYNKKSCKSAAIQSMSISSGLILTT